MTVADFGRPGALINPPFADNLQGETARRSLVGGLIGPFEMNPYKPWRNSVSS